MCGTGVSDESRFTWAAGAVGALRWVWVWEVGGARSGLEVRVD